MQENQEKKWSLAIWRALQNRPDGFMIQAYDRRQCPQFARIHISKTGILCMCFFLKCRSIFSGFHGAPPNNTTGPAFICMNLFGTASCEPLSSLVSGYIQFTLGHTNRSPLDLESKSFSKSSRVSWIVPDMTLATKHVERHVSVHFYNISCSQICLRWYQVLMKVGSDSWSPFQAGNELPQLISSIWCYWPSQGFSSLNFGVKTRLIKWFAASFYLNLCKDPFLPQLRNHGNLEWCKVFNELVQFQFDLTWK